jgi:hypothetical protein
MEVGNFKADCRLAWNASLSALEEEINKYDTREDEDDFVAGRSLAFNLCLDELRKLKDNPPIDTIINALKGKELK